MNMVQGGIAAAIALVGLAACGAVETINVSDGKELVAAVGKILDIRKANRDTPVEVVLAAGDYELPLSLGLYEGKTFISSSTAPVVFRAAPGARPRLCGGRVVKRWRRTSFNGRDDVWVADVSAPKFLQLITFDDYVNIPIYTISSC